MIEPSPVAGDPVEAHAAALHLGRVLSSAQRFSAFVSEARLNLRRNSSQSITRLDSGLSVHVLDAARRVLVSVESGRAAFHTYGGQTEQIHEQARRIGHDVEVQLDAIRVSATRIEAIEAVVGRRLSSEWQTGVPLLLAESLIDSARVSAWGAHLFHSSSDALANEWREAANRWWNALEQIERWQLKWRGLYQDRIEAERQLVAVLRKTTLREGFVLGAGIGTTSVAGVGPGASPATSATFLGSRPVSGEHPAKRRTHPLLAQLYRGSMSSMALTGKQAPVAEVESWWAQLSDRDKHTLTTEVPLVIGNLNGVPLDVRVKTNSISAKYFAEADGIGSEEANYWGQVAAGSVKLVVSDPEKSRIVEMLGEISPATERVITYLPGTTSQMKHFYSGEVQQVSAYLVEHSRETTVAFVYKDGSWVSWLGAGSNTNYVRLGDLGMQVADFQEQVVAREPTLRNLPMAAVAHSAGMSVASGAEIAGAQFDSVLSLGGAFNLSGWKPNPETSYHHFQYENDAINLIDGGRLHTPNELTGVFGSHKYPSDGFGRIESHGRIAEGVQTNGKALKDMLDTLEGEL